MDDLVKRAQEALEGATEGPWQPGEALVGAVVNWHLPASHPNAIVCQEATEGDAFFIAEARQLVPDMLDRIEAAPARIRELEALVSEARGKTAYYLAALDHFEDAMSDDTLDQVHEARRELDALLARMGERDDRS